MKTGAGSREPGVGNTLARFPVPGSRFPTRFNGELGADERLQSGGERRLMKARRARDAVAIEQRDRRIAERRGSIDERFRQRCGTQEAEGGGTMKLDVRCHER